MGNERTERIEQVKKRISEKNLAGILVSKMENQIYLSDFPSSNCSLILTSGTCYLLTDFRYIEAAAAHCPMYETVLLGGDYTKEDFLKELNLENLGVECDTLAVNDYGKLNDALENTLLSDASGIIEDIRSVKDVSELQAIERAVALTDKCFSHILEYIKPGMSEKEVALEVQFYFLKNGAERLAFDTICVSGERTSLPHGVPTDKKLEKGDFVTLDMGCVIDGYCSDMTRTVAIGQVSAKQRQLYNLVLYAQETALEKLKPGLTFSQGDALARDVIKEAGYLEYFGHGLGHGVGLEIHEAPTLSPKGIGVLQEGMTVTVEPGIYLPKKFGVRIEDLAILTSFGIINNVRSKKELIIL